MAVTTLDPNTALIVVDLQRGILARRCIHPSEQILARASRLADIWRQHGLPVVLVNVNAGAPGRTESPLRRGAPEPGWDQLAAELNARSTDLLVTKRSWGAFMHTGLAQALRERGVTQVVVCGIATSLGVESTARQAYELGFNVTLAVDAMTDFNEDTHRSSIEQIFPRLGETGTCEEIIALLGTGSPPNRP